MTQKVLLDPSDKGLLYKIIQHVKELSSKILSIKITQGGSDVSVANPLPVTITDTSIDVTIANEVEITNDSGNPIPVGSETDGGTPTGKAVMVAGTTSGNIVQFLEVNSSGQLSVTDGGGSLTVDGTVAISNFPATQPVSATSLPLAPNAATETTLASINTKTPSLGQGVMTGSQPVVIASDQSSVPVLQTPIVASGSISTQNLVPNGVATTLSAVSITLNGASQLSIQVTGTYTGALSVQVTNDGSRWETITATSLVNFITGAYTATIASATVGIFILETSSFAQARITGLAAMTGSAVVTLRASFNTPSVATRSIPSGSNVMGAVTQSGTFTVQPGNTANTTAWLVNSQGSAAHSAAVSGNPVYTGGKVVPSTIATIDATLVAGDAVGVPVTTSNQKVIKPFGTSELDYHINFSSAVSTTTVQPLVPASGTANIRNYIASLILSSDTIALAGNAWILDSALTVSSIAITTGLVTTSTVHDLKVGDSIVFTTLASGTGVSTNTVYYVTTVGSTTTFNFSATIGGSNVVPSVAYTGTTMYRILHQIRLQTVAIGTPAVISFQTPLRGIANTALNLLIPTSLTTGNIYLSVNGYRNF